jgi:hypothetical protein
MESGNEARAPQYQYLLAGLETGVIAALILLAWLGLSAKFFRRSFWTSPNIMASTFYGEAALRNHFSFATFSGLALYLLIYGTVGALFGLAMREMRASLRIACIGILVAIWWYYLSFGVLWKRWNPLMLLYTHDRPMFVAHVLYGAFLGRYPGSLRRLRLRLGADRPA